jgi:Protein of unknown function (DUF2849)
MARMIIANRLTDGLVVFLTGSETWELGIGAGIVIEDEAEQQRLLEVAKRHERQCLVIDPSLIDVEIDAGQPRPTSIREAIRAFGPTV